MVTGSFGALRRLAAHGRGVALLPRLAIARELREGDLVALDLVTPPRPVAIEARWRAGRDDSALASMLRIAGRHTREAYEAAG
jgi:DNA-binding transcriptional LysR family regulator